jgi:predicted ATPase
LAAVVHKPEAELQAALTSLAAAGLMFRQGIPPQATYLFKHALVQDAAYGTLLRMRRQQLHGRIAAVLDEEFPETKETNPETIARHCAEAGLDEKAIRYWRTAGEQAARRASNREAIGHFRQALALNEKQPPGVARLRAELSILSQLGPALMSVHGWSAPEVGVVSERAEDLARQLESSVDLAPPLAGLWLFHTTGGQFARADKITDELFNIARGLDDPGILLSHITARGQFAGLLERLPMPRCISTRDWQFMTKFYMRNYAFSIRGTIRLFVVSQLRRFCSGFSAIQRKGYA